MALDNTFVKDPNATLDYTISWPLWLDGDTITTSSWTATTGITIASSSNTTTAATVWLSGGTASTRYTVTNRVTTAGGRIDDRSIYINVREK